MKKKCRQAAAFLLALLLLTGTLPIQAQAAAKPAAVQKITLSKNQYVLKKGEKLKLKASVSPSKAKASVKLKWKSSNKKVAQVSPKGVVTAKAKKGKAKITVTAGRKKASCTITVGTPVKKINASGFMLTEGETAKLKASVLPKKASVKKLSYQSSAPEIVSADKKGNVTAKKQGTARITITAADRNKIKKTVDITVIKQKQPDTYKNPEITVSRFSADTVNNITDDTVTVTGTASAHSASIAAVSYTLSYAAKDQPPVSGTAEGADEWKITNLPLKIGTNVLSVTASDSNQRSTTKEIVFNRLSTEIHLAENVVLFEEDKNLEISNDILDFRMDDRGTEDKSDDVVKVLFYENSELVQSLKNGQIKAGDVVMLQPCEALYMGFNGVVVSHEDPADAEQYPAGEYEEISFRAADFTDIYSDEISLSYEIADVENPLAFAYFPTDVEIAALDDEGNRSKVLYASDGYDDSSNEQQISGAGFQKNAISYMMSDALNITGGLSSSSGLNFGLTFKDAVLYDQDGSAKTTNDQFKIGGKIAYENLKVDAGIEWHPGLLDLLPQQIMAKYTYNTKVDMHADWTGSADLSDLVKNANKALNNEFENNKQFLGMTLSGVDMSDSILLGMFGLQISPVGINTTVGIKNTQYSSVFNKLSAIIVIMPVLDVTGKISAKAGITYNYSSYHENGINMQKKDFVGSYGSLEENKGQSSIGLPFDRSIEIYDVCAKSEKEKNEDPEWSVVFSGEGEAVEEAAFGADIGLMVSGIMPASVKGRIYEKAEAKASGKIKFGNGLYEAGNKVNVKVDGAIQANLRIGLKAGAYFKLAAKTDLFSPEFSAEKEWNHDFYQMTVASISGAVVQADDDTDDTNNEALEHVKVCLTEKTDSGIRGRRFQLAEAYTDAKGRFVFPNIKDGDYELEFSKDGYQTYRQDVTMEGENQEFMICMEPAGFQNTLAELIEEKGIFKAEQRGTMLRESDAWFHPEGLMGARISDYDSDGEDEMLVCYTKQIPGSAEQYGIYMDMYELVNGEVVLADSTSFSAYKRAYNTVLSPAEDTELFCGVNTVWADGNCYLMCEEDEQWRAFGDEMAQNYWLMSYQDNKFRYAGSLTGVEGVFFGFTGYEFKNGSLTSSKLYYGDEYGEENGQTPLYDDFAVAAAQFFTKFGISLTDDVELIRDVELGSVLSDRNEKAKIFELTNRLDNDAEDSYEFAAALKRDPLLDEVQQ